MKKLLIITLVLALILSLAACGGSGGGGSTTTPPASNSTTPPAPSGNDNSTSAPPSSTPEETPSSGNTRTEDLTTIEGWLAAFDLTENDLKCAHYNRLDINSYVTSTGKITEVGVFVSEKLTDEEARAWIEQIITKLNSLSESGKIDRLLGEGEALTADYIMEQQMYIGSGSYHYKGKAVNVVIVVMPGNLDSDDPDDAMAACSLGLEWK